MKIIEVLNKQKVSNMNNVDKLLGVKESYKAPDVMMDKLLDTNNRHDFFMSFLQEFNFDVSYDWFNEYFQDDHADRAKLKQDFTPKEVGEILSNIVDYGNSTFESCSGTGGLIIKKWNNDRFNTPMHLYVPSNFLYTCEEMSHRALPFLLFNLMIRGMNAVVIHCDSLSRECDNVYLVQNDKDDFLSFSNLNIFPKNKDVEEYFNVNFSNKDDVQHTHIESNVLLELLNKNVNQLDFGF